MPRNGVSFSNKELNDYLDKIELYTDVINSDPNSIDEKDKQAILNAKKNLLILAGNKFSNIVKKIGSVEREKKVKEDASFLSTILMSSNPNINNDERNKLAEDIILAIMYRDSHGADKPDLMFTESFSSIIKYITMDVLEEELLDEAKKEIEVSDNFKASLEKYQNSLKQKEEEIVQRDKEIEELLNTKLEFPKEEPKKEEVKEVKEEQPVIEVEEVEKQLYIAPTITFDSILSIERSADELAEQLGIKELKGNEILNKVKQDNHLEEYKAYISMKTMAVDERRKHTALERDMSFFEDYFKNAMPGSLNFYPRFREVAAKIAKGDTKLKTQEGIRIDGDFKKACQYLNEVLKVEYQLDTLGMNNYDEISKVTEREYQDKTVEDIRNLKEDRDTIEELFANCRTAKDFKKVYEKTVDNIISGRVQLKTLPNELSNNTKDLGIITERLSNIVKEATNVEDRGIQIEEIGRKIVDSKLDGIEFAREMHNKFYEKDLGISRNADLTDKEQTYITNRNFKRQGEEIDQSAEAQKAYRKADGLKAQKDDKVLDNALSTYARLKEVHNNRGFFFFILHPQQNGAEKNAIKLMENSLKARFNFTTAELNAIGSEKARLSSDDINLGYIGTKSGKIVKEELIQEVELRNSEIQNYISTGKIRKEENKVVENKPKLEDKLKNEFGRKTVGAKTAKKDDLEINNLEKKEEKKPINRNSI